MRTRCGATLKSSEGPEKSSLSLIQTTVDLLDAYKALYAELSGRRVSSYQDYVKLGLAD